MGESDAARRGRGGAECPARRGYHHGNLRAALVEAALGILEAEGIDALSLRSTARAAGVSQTAPYHHFGCKEGLLAAVAAEGFRRMAHAMQHPSIQSVDCSVDSDAKVRALGTVYIRYARRNPELFKLMFGPLIQNREAHPELDVAYQSGYAAIEEATAEHLVRIGGDPAHVNLVVTVAWSLVHGLSVLLNDRKVVPGEGGLPAEDDLIDAVLSGLDWRAAAQSPSR